MTGTNLRAVFSHPAPEVTQDQYNEYYDFHVGRILTYDGFLGARRYRLTTRLGDTSPAVYEYLSVYEIDGDPIEVLRPLRSDVKARNVAHPDWFRNLVRSSWSCYALDPSPIGWLFERPRLVLSSAPESIDDDSYAAGYARHLEDHLGQVAVDGGGRFSLVNGTTDDAAPSNATFLALYSASADLDATDLVPDDGEAPARDRFVVLDGVALGPVRRPGEGA